MPRDFVLASLKYEFSAATFKMCRIRNALVLWYAAVTQPFPHTPFIHTHTQTHTHTHINPKRAIHEADHSGRTV
jgi:hypothetical protein